MNRLLLFSVWTSWKNLLLCFVVFLWKTLTVSCYEKPFVENHSRPRFVSFFTVVCQAAMNAAKSSIHHAGKCVCHFLLAVCTKTAKRFFSWKLAFVCTNESKCFFSFFTLTKAIIIHGVSKYVILLVKCSYSDMGCTRAMKTSPYVVKDGTNVHIKFQQDWLTFLEKKFFI